MYFFYIDESGNLDPEVAGKRSDGTTFEKDPIYVMVAVSLLEHKWQRFQRRINAVKLELIEDVSRATGRHFDLADVEVHSNVLRIPKARNRHPFFTFLSPAQLKKLTDVYYEELSAQYMRVFAVVVDKRKTASFLDQSKLHRKAYELLVERVQLFLAEFHPGHLGVIVTDDTNRQLNRALTMKHSWFQRVGTTSGLQLRNIVETPFFTRSELSNGVQLADLCAYNVYRVFRRGNPDYAYFQPMLPRFYCSKNTPADKLDGLKVFPDDSELLELAAYLGKKAARP